MNYPMVSIEEKDLEGINFKTEPRIYNIFWDGIRFPFLISRKENINRAVVIGTGHYDRKKYKDEVVFNRHSWANDIRATCIYYADPTIDLSKDDCLFWGYGRNEDWYLERVGRLLMRILGRMSIRIEDTLFFGSSGGGFTAIALATILRGRAFAINPQLICTNFWPRIVQVMKDTCLRDGEQIIEERLDIAKLAKKAGYMPYVYLMINSDSERDFNTQLQPFLRELRDYNLPIERVKICEYYHNGGHSAMPDKKECIYRIHDELDAWTNDSQKYVDLFKKFYMFGISNLYPDSKVVEKAKGISNGIMYCHGEIDGMSYDINNIDWGARFSDIPNTFQLYLQSLNPVSILTRAYELSKDTEFLNVAMILIRSWKKYSQSQENREKNRYIFIDHSVAQRTKILIYYTKVCVDAEYQLGNLHYLFDVMCECGDWLSDSKNYTLIHNHGIMEDEALLYLGKLMDRSDWVELGKKRLNEQYKHAFGKDGVHVENSSSYHKMVMRMFKSIQMWLKSVDDNISLDVASVESSDYINWIKLPNGYLAQVGDTVGDIRGAQRATNTKLQRNTADIHKMFPDTGIYFYRSRSDKDVGMDTWKTIKAGYSCKTHKHADDGSFMLYSKGYEIFTDAGFCGYKSDGFRKYISSAKAHNFIIVDGQSWGISDENMAKVGVKEYKLNADYDEVKVFNDAYKGVHIERIFSSLDDLTVIRDSISSTEEHTYTQIFHLGECMEILESDSKEVKIKIGDSGYILRLRQHGKPVSLKVYKGDSSKADYGIVYRGVNNINETSTLTFSMTGKSGYFITSLAIEDSEGYVRLFDRFMMQNSLKYDSWTEQFKWNYRELENACNIDKYEDLTKNIESFRSRYVSDSKIFEKKKNYESLGQIADTLEPSQFSVEHCGWHFECLYQRGEDLGDNLYVMFNGKRLPKAEYPRFVRWSYFGLKSGTMLNIDDPMCCRFPDLRLGWLYGDKDTSVAALVVDIVKAVCRNEGRNYKDVVFFGSSGGGYDAIYCSSLLPESLSISINPNIILKKTPYAQEFSVITGIYLDKPDKLGRNDVSRAISSSKSHHVILVNADSRDDIDYHILPLCRKMSAKPCFGLAAEKNLLLWIYDCPDIGSGPHNSVETKHNFDFIVDIALKFHRGALSDGDKSLAKSMGELWQELFMLKKKVADEKALVNSFTGLALQVQPGKETYHLGERIKVNIISSCLDWRKMKCAWWILHDNKVIRKLPYSKDVELNIILPSSRDEMIGTYVIRCYVKNNEGKVVVVNSERIIVEV